MRRLSILMICSGLLCAASLPGEEQNEQMPEQMPEQAGLDLITETPDAGFALAIQLARRAVTTIQPDKEVLKEGRKEYAQDPDSLIAASHVVAIHFQTISAANNYWRD